MEGCYLKPIVLCEIRHWAPPCSQNGMIVITPHEYLTVRLGVESGSSYRSITISPKNINGYNPDNNQKMYWEWWLEFNIYAKYKDWFPLHLFLYAMHVNRYQKLFGYQHSLKYLWNNSRVSHSWQNFHFGVNYPFKRNLWKMLWSLLLVDFANLMYVMIKRTDLLDITLFPAWLLTSTPHFQAQFH